jgi:hypothetical protein
MTAASSATISRTVVARHRVSVTSSGNVNVLTLPFSNTGNVAVGINQIGNAIGYYTDSAGANHGWVGIP